MAVTEYFPIVVFRQPGRKKMKFASDEIKDDPGQVFWYTYHFFFGIFVRWIVFKFADLFLLNRYDFGPFHTIEKFAKKYNLGDPWAADFFTTAKVNFFKFRDVC